MSRLAEPSLSGSSQKTRAASLGVVSTAVETKSVEVVQAIIEQYRKEHPNVDITYQNIRWGDFVTKARVSAVAGEDLGMQFSWDFLSGELKTEDLVVWVDDLIEKIGVDDFVKTSLTPFNGHFFSVPCVMTSTVLWYRTDLFQEKGLEPPVTWDDLRACCVALTEDTTGDGTTDRWAVTLPFSRTASVHSFAFSFLKSNGGHLLAEDGSVVWDSRQNIETVEYLKSLLPYSTPGWREASWGEQIANHHRGATAMCSYTGRLLSRTKENDEGIYRVTKCVELPTPNGRPEERITLVESGGVAIWKDAADLDVAKDFAQFFLTGDRQVEWVHAVPTFYLPSRKSTLNSSEYWNHPILREKRESIEIMLKALEKGTNLYSEYGVFSIDGNRIYSSTLIQDCFAEIMVEDEPVKETMQKYTKLMRELLGHG